MEMSINWTMYSQQVGIVIVLCHTCPWYTTHSSSISIIHPQWGLADILCPKVYKVLTDFLGYLLYCALSYVINIQRYIQYLTLSYVVHVQRYTMHSWTPWDVRCIPSIDHTLSYVVHVQKYIQRLTLSCRTCPKVYGYTTYRLPAMSIVYPEFCSLMSYMSKVYKVLSVYGDERPSPQYCKWVYFQIH